MFIPPRKFLWILAILGVVMSLVALNVDLHDFFETPWYLWIFVPICPLYPMLLALNYLFFLRKGEYPPMLLVFTFFGIVGYGVVAPVFYTLYMADNGFSWYEFGNIFWVLLYSAQAGILWPHLKTALLQLRWWQFLAIPSYFFSKDLLDRFSVTWSYVRYGVLSELLMNRVLVVLFVVHFAIFTLFLALRKGKGVAFLRRR